MPVYFPSNPTEGQTYTANGNTWTFGGGNWNLTTHGNEPDVQASLTGSSFGYSPSSVAVQGVVARLRRGQSAVLHLGGDSTGDETDEWFGLLGQALGRQYPNHSVIHRKWNDGNQNYDPPTYLQTGSAGERYAKFASGQLTYSATSITGDLDVFHRVRATDWTSGSGQILSARWETTGNQRAWQFSISATGRPTFLWSADGTNTVATITSSAAVSFTDGNWGWVRVTFDVDNGASGNDVRFYTSTDGVTWTQLGTTQTTAGVTSIFNSSASYMLGSATTAFSSPFAGDIGWTEIRSGISGYSVVPPLPEKWEQTTSSASNSVLHMGAPVILLNNGSQSGQGVAYQDNATRRPKLFGRAGQDVVFLSSSHNDGTSHASTWLTTVNTWLTNIKTQLPYTPIVLLGQNPTASPISDNQVALRHSRGAALATYAASQTGVYYFDAYPAFTATSQVEAADGVHPTDAGSAVWANAIYSALFTSI